MTDTKLDWQWLADAKKCGAKRRHSDLPCGDWAVPFGVHCRRHGGNHPAAREKARQAALQYEMWSTDPPWRKALRLRRWRESARALEMRQARKKGPEAVAHLKAHWEAEEAEKKAWAEDTRKAKAEQRAREKALLPPRPPRRQRPYPNERRKQQATPAPTPVVEQPRFIAYDDDWGF